MNQPRVEPLSPEQLTAEQRTFLEPFTTKRGTYPNVFGTLVHHMDLAKAWSGFGMYMLRENQLDPVHREVLILRTARLINSEYEWHQHRKIALHIGMTEETIECIRNNKPLTDPQLQMWLVCANELVSEHRLSDSSWQNLTGQFDITYVLDAIFTVGAYTALGMALNSCDVQVESDE